MAKHLTPFLFQNEKVLKFPFSQQVMARCTEEIAQVWHHGKHSPKLSRFQAKLNFIMRVYEVQHAIYNLKIRLVTKPLERLYVHSGISCIHKAPNGSFRLSKFAQQPHIYLSG